MKQILCQEDAGLTEDATNNNCELNCTDRNKFSTKCLIQKYRYLNKLEVNVKAKVPKHTKATVSRDASARFAWIAPCLPLLENKEDTLADGEDLWGPSPKPL